MREQRSLIEQIDLSPCYAVSDGGASWIVRCRHCSAGWLPSKDSRAGLAPLLRHARKKHKIRLQSIPRPIALQNAHAPPYIPGMPIQIPADAKIVRDSRITLIRLISHLNDRLVEGEDGLKARVKKTLADKGADYAESDLVVAALRAGTAKGTIDARKLYDLVKARKLTLDQFLGCVSVSKKPLEKLLGGAAIESLTTRGPAAEPSLCTEFKAGVELDVDQLAQTLAGAVAHLVPIKAA